MVETKDYIWVFLMRKGRPTPVAASYMVGREDKRENNVPSPKKQCSCRLEGYSENGAFER